MVLQSLLLTVYLVSVICSVRRVKTFDMSTGHAGAQSMGGIKCSFTSWNSHGASIKASIGMVMEAKLTGDIGQG